MRPPCDDALIRSSPEHSPCRRDARAWVLTATILGSSMALIDSTVVNVALPALQSNFHATIAGVQWVVEAYGLFLAALILVGGSLGDSLGRRRTFVIGTFIFALSSIACGLASSIGQLIAARSVQGVGAALLVPGSLAIISACFDEESRGAAIGTWSGVTAITTAIGPVIGGWLVEHASWRWAFFINLPVAAAVIAISYWRVPESRSPDAGRIDWLGACLITCGLAGIVVGFVESVSRGWKDPVVYGGVLAGIVCVTLFVRMEMKTASPMVPFEIFASSAFTGANLLTLLLYSAIGIFFFLFPLNLIQVQRYTATAAGAAILPLILLMFLLSRWSGGLVARFGPRLPLIVGPLIVAVGFALFVIPSITESYWRSFFLPLVTLGFGMAVTVAPLTTVVMNSVTQNRVGVGSGINNAVARVAGVLAIAVFGILMANAFGYRLTQELKQYSLPPNISHEIAENKIKLAGIDLPQGIDSNTATRLRRSVGDAFIFGFRWVMLMCVLLSIGSAAIAWRMVPKGSSSSAIAGSKLVLKQEGHSPEKREQPRRPKLALGIQPILSVLLRFPIVRSE